MKERERDVPGSDTLEPRNKRLHRGPHFDERHGDGHPIEHHWPRRHLLRAEAVTKFVIVRDNFEKKL